MSLFGILQNKNPREITVLNSSVLVIIYVVIYSLGQINAKLAGRKPDANAHPVLKKINSPKWSPDMQKIRTYFQQLYVLQAPAVWLIWMEGNDALSFPILCFAVQFMFYLMWPILCFRFKRLDLAAVDAVFVWFLADYTIYQFWKVNPWAAFLMYPYLGWITTAAFLSIFLWIKNRGNDLTKDLPRNELHSS